MSNVLRTLRASLSFALANPKMLAGIAILAVLLLFSFVGPMFVDLRNAEPISVSTNQRPSAELWLGSDSGGRDLLAVMIAATPQTLRMGVLAGALGVAFGVFLGLVAGYWGGWRDRVISTVTDTMLTIPPLAILLVVAASMRSITVEIMAVIIAALSWMFAARIIRAQVLSLREQNYVKMAKLSGMSDLRVVLTEVLPNIVPLAFAAFVGAVSGAILAGIGLEVLGLGPQNTPTLGMTIYWALLYSAFSRGMWWWWLPPILILIALFISLFLITAALDEVANPKLRRSRK
ncbi:ABC transporter permease [Pelagovum pacificum]|uniref:ABC transporter permease n=1 Tax=Pelagovum pacificum TaxID=2588711 RepID=A0A5C5G9V5_9RHOB|nr:ABC transporter permease [Pelagovum pacificum]QQA42475.1 ABC transporter permease [Pelagovum pacificum]TNY31558.1 ABC transporter permease [Pelagovum pacificum]